jgi:hypothetical protein
MEMQSLQCFFVVFIIYSNFLLYSQNLIEALWIRGEERGGGCEGYTLI